MTVTRYRCELAWLGDTAATAEPDVVLEVDGSVLVGVTSAATTAAVAGRVDDGDVVRLPGLTLPGLANAHSHAFHRALRGRTQAGSGSFWTWREQMYALAGSLTPDSYFELARAVYGEMVLAGVTGVGEFHYLHHGPDGTPYADANAMGAALAAAAGEAGLRITLLDTCYLQGGVTAGLKGAQVRFGDGDALSWATRASELDALVGQRVRVGAAIHSVRAVDPASMQIVAAWAAGRNAPLHAHVSEQPAENDQCHEAYGCSPTALLARHGVLSERFTAVHATHLSAADVALLGGHGCTTCFCPTTERDLADGIGPARALRDAGARLSLGSDSHAVVDLFEEARAVELDERLATNVRGGHDSVSLLRAATAAGHASLGWPEAGRLAVGAPADFVTVGLGSVRLAGTGPTTALDAVVFAATAADVRQVVVGGEIVVADGRHQRFDVAAELAHTIGVR